ATIDGSAVETGDSGAGANVRTRIRSGTSATPPDVRKAFGFPVNTDLLLLRLRLGSEAKPQVVNGECCRNGTAFPHIGRQSRSLPLYRFEFALLSSATAR